MIELFSDRVLVVQEQPEQTTASGIIIPDSAKAQPLKGVVYASGKGINNEPMCDSAHKGDTVLFDNFRYPEVEVDGVKCLLMRQSDIIGKLIIKTK